MSVQAGLQVFYTTKVGFFHEVAQIAFDLFKIMFKLKNKTVVSPTLSEK